jgi:aspartate/methionine/tyrosine aminotransferase
MLSKRAQSLVAGSTFNEMWEVIRDKWDMHENPDGFVNLGVAENYLMRRELEACLTQHVQIAGSNATYDDGPVGSQRLRTALAHFLSAQLKTTQPLEADQIVATNGVLSALEHVAWALTDEGDVFLLGRPYYGEATLGLRPHVRTVAVTFGTTDPFSVAAIECYEKALMRAQARGIVVRGLLLCSPHNPLGRCYPREVLCLVALCAQHSLHLVSDEIYALSVWREPCFTSVLSLPLDGVIDPTLVHVVWGISKDFCANEWRLGCLVSPANPMLRAAVAAVAIYSYPSSIADHVVAQMLEDRAFTTKYLRKNRQRLNSAYTLVTGLLEKHSIPFATGTHAGLFVWADLGHAYRRHHNLKRTDIDDSVVAYRIREALYTNKVYLAWGGNFDSETPGLFRVSFAHSSKYMEEGFRRIELALRSEAPLLSVP